MTCSKPQIFRGKEVSCGRCQSCLERKLSLKRWFVRSRITSEICVAPRSWFVTLTLRKSMSDQIGYRIVQRWLRRMRKAKFGPLRYACVAEHGSRSTRRLHYHVVLHGPTTLTERRIRSMWRGGISEATLIRSTDAQSVARYSSKAAGYTAKGGGRLRCSLGYGSQALVKLMNSEIVQEVRREFPEARVRLRGCLIPMGLLPEAPPFRSRWSDELKRDAHQCYVAMKNEKPRKRGIMKGG